MVYTTILLLLALAYQAASFQPIISPQRFGISTQSMSVNDESSSSSSTDDPVSRLPLMEAELALSETSKERKVELEQAISDAKTSAEFGVRASQFKFYEAFSNQDEEAMRDVWSSSENIRCIHPGMEGLSGVEEVMKSWKLVFGGPPFPIEPKRVSIDICGMTALCSCIEETSNGGKLEALNVYRREGGSWKMTLHMASPIVMRVASSSDQESE